MLLMSMLGTSLQSLSLGPLLTTDEHGSFARDMQNDLVLTIAKLTQLTELVLSSTAALVAAKLSAGLLGLVELRKLRLSKLQLRDAHTAQLAASLEGMSHLAALDLSDNKLHDKGIRTLAEALSKLCKLESLMLQHNYFTGSGAMAVYNAVHTLPCLVRVGLSEGQRSDPAVEQFRRLPRLYELTL